MGYNFFGSEENEVVSEYTIFGRNKILKQNVFAKPEENVRIPHLDSHQEIETNRIIERGVNSK